MPAIMYAFGLEKEAETTSVNSACKSFSKGIVLYGGDDITADVAKAVK